METIKKIQQSWELEKKAELVRLGQSSKPYSEILPYLENEIANSNRMTNFDYKIPCFKNDGIYQLSRAIEEIVGVSTVATNKGPSGERPMNTIDIVLKGGIRKKVPFGNIELPDMGEDAVIQIAYSDGEKRMYVRGKCQFKFQSLIDSVIDMTKHLLKTDSIYKDLTIEIDERVDNGQPIILDVESLESEVMILSEETESAIRPLKARILHPEKCKTAKIPLKFGAILEGPYGTGKTLLAFKLALEANNNNWAVIYLKTPHLLADTLRMAKTLDKNGNGIVVFVEDIDQVTKGDRDAAMQDILNTLDGGDTKDMNVIALFTTNHVELIDPTFLRGKRIGTIISMTFLDAVTAEKYVAEFCKGIELTGDFAPVYELIAQNQIAPAFMAEIIENVKSDLVFSDEQVITATDLKKCVNSYLRQVQLSRTKDLTVTPEKALATALISVIHSEDYYNNVKDVVTEVMDNQ